MNTITATVLQRGEARFTMTGEKLPHNLHDSDQTISPGLVKRLHKYALTSLVESGFEVQNWRCEIYTMDADERPSDRYYTVEFTNAKGGMIGVQGISTNHGHPFLDHGICCDWGRTQDAD